MPPPSSSSSRSDQAESHELLKRPRSLSAPSIPINSSRNNVNHDPAGDSDSDSSGYELDDFDDLEASSGLLRNSGRGHKSTFSSSSSPLIRWCASCASHLRIFIRHSAGLRHRFFQFGFIFFVASLSLLVFTFIFNPSYTRDQYPSNYRAVTSSVRKGGGENPKGFWRSGDGKGKVTSSGRGNPDGVKVYIAANIINADLISGAWGDAVMELMDLIGEKNVFLSIFENDSGPLTKAALNSLDTTIAARMPLAGRSIVSTTLSLSSIPRVKLPTGETYIKRITYLAEIRNRAMLPLIGYIPSMKRWGQKKHIYRRGSEWEVEPVGLDPKDAPAMPPQWVEKPETYGRVLFLNDVVFDPVQALHLLFSTNGGEYTAACGMDFINSFKFYDTFATRDIDGWNSGVPFYPFFAPGRSRGFVERGSDAVPVKSCWGGIVAFDATVFVGAGQNDNSVKTRDDDDDDDGDDDEDEDEDDGDGKDEDDEKDEDDTKGDHNKKKPKPNSASTPEQSQNTPHRPVLFRSEKAPYWDASECCLIHADIAASNSTFINPFIRVAYSESTFQWLPAVKRIERLFRGPHWVLAKVLGMPWGGEKRTVGSAGYCGSSKLLVMKEEGGRGWKGIPVPDSP